MGIYSEIWLSIEKIGILFSLAGEACFSRGGIVGRETPVWAAQEQKFTNTMPPSHATMGDYLVCHFLRSIKSLRKGDRTPCFCAMGENGPSFEGGALSKSKQVLGLFEEFLATC